MSHPEISNIYRPRQPRASPLYQVIERFLPQFERCYGDRYAARYSPWRGVIGDAARAFFPCGDPHFGFARVRCPDCRHEMFVAFSCRGRCLCPSCHQKRTMLAAETIAHAICQFVPHRQRVFTIPKRLRLHFRTAESLPPASPQEPVSDVAVIYSEQAVHWLKGGLSRLHNSWVTRQRREYNLSGVPWRQYYARDLAAGKVPPARLYVFQNIVDLDAETASAIESLKRDGATLVFPQSTGFVQGAEQAKRIGEVMGLSVRPAAGAGKIAAPVVGDHPLLTENLVFKVAERGGHHKQAIEWQSESAWVVDDPEATVLAVYEESSQPAFALREHDDCNSVFVGGHYLNRHTIRSLAGWAGAWVVAPAGYAVAARDDPLMVHPLDSGPVTLRLKFPAALEEVEPGTIRSEVALEHKIALEAGHTYLLRLKKP